MMPVSDLLNQIASYRTTTSPDGRCVALANAYLPDAGEAVKDAFAREIQQVADDFCAELEARKSAEAA